MIIIPAIDLIDAKAVRLTKGDYNQKKIYNESPLAVAQEFEAAGFTHLHLVADIQSPSVALIKNLACEIWTKTHCVRRNPIIN